MSILIKLKKHTIKWLEFEGSTEYSVSIHSLFGTISKKLVPKAISTFHTRYLFSKEKNMMLQF